MFSTANPLPIISINTAWNSLKELIEQLNQKLEKHSPVKIALGTIAAVLIIQKIAKVHLKYRHLSFSEITDNIKNSSIENIAYDLLAPLPIVGDIAKAESNKKVKSFLTPMYEKANQQTLESGLTEINLPEEKTPVEEIEKIFDSLNDHYTKGKLSGTEYAVYDEDLTQALLYVYEKTMLANHMHPNWPLINRMEAQVVMWLHNLFNSDINISSNELPKHSPGFITDGGTRSIFEACRAYVSYAKLNNIEQPEIIIPSSAHVSFYNAAEALGAKLIVVKVDPVSKKADVKAMQSKITSNTCLMVASAPSFPTGVFDPVEELAEIASAKNIPVHVDACLGGLLNVFAKDAKFKIPKADFNLPSVMSISCDPHKYGYAPKGVSVVLYRQSNPATSTFMKADWEGGIYPTRGMIGSLRANAVASAWTVMKYFGKKGYVNFTKEILTLAQQLASSIKKIEGLKLINEPEFSVLAITTTNKISAALVTDRMGALGYEFNHILPEGFHFCLTPVHVKKPNFARDFITDLISAVTYAIENKEVKPSTLAKIYGDGTLIRGFPKSVEQEIGERYIGIQTALPTEWHFNLDNPEAGNVEIIYNLQKHTSTIRTAQFTLLSINQCNYEILQNHYLNLTTNPPYTPSDAKKYLKTNIEKWNADNTLGIYSIFLNETNRFVGALETYYVNEDSKPAAQIEIQIDKNSQGSSYSSGISSVIIQNIEFLVANAKSFAIKDNGKKVAAPQEIRAFTPEDDIVMQKVFQKHLGMPKSLYLGKQFLLFSKVLEAKQANTTHHQSPGNDHAAKPK